MKIAIASGKGGVGKSMLSSSLAILFSHEKKIVAVDCDVDAPDLGIWLGNAEPIEGQRISTSELASIDYDKCIGCGKCISNCRFGAIKMIGGKPTILPYLCEGCAVCKTVCPKDAIKIEPVENGEIARIKTRFDFPLFSGLMYPGNTGSGKVVTALKEKAAEMEHELMILDSAAGIGCPVIASLSGADYVLLVTEPTPSGFSDLLRVLDIVRHFKIPYGIVINKWDINKELSEKMAEWAGETLLGKIPFDESVFVAVSELKPILETDSKVVPEIISIFKTVKDRIGQ